MPDIKVLSKEISELIAAGEVIERPASVIKELVENSIDSGARHITVEIKNGGTTYMRVTDDGCGMSFDDVPTAFLRHATSKINTAVDLDNISTLGFRGEALASVAAVSRVEVMTKQHDETYGTVYKIEGSTETFHEKSGCPDGTTIMIRDLFYNVPARRKFMKKDVTEANAVSNIIQKITLSHPEISFRMIRDNRTEFTSAGDGELYSSIYAVYGRDFARDLIEADYTYSGVRVWGYVVKPLYSRPNRAFQNFFVNGRYVRSKVCSAALENGYSNLIMTGKYPACVLMVELPPSAMDVNIHPAKAEIRFTDERKVSDAIFFAVKNAMVNNGLIYEFQLRQHDDWNKPVPEETVIEQQEFMFTPVNEIPAKEEQISAPPVRTAPLTDENDDTPPETVGIQASEKYSSQPYVQPAAPLNVPVPPVLHREENTVPDLMQQEEKNSPPPEEKPAPPSPIEGFSYISTDSFTDSRPSPDIRTPEKEPESEWTSRPKIRVIGEAFGLYIIAELGEDTLIMIDKHAAHERILFEKLRSRNCRQYSQMLIQQVKVLLTADEASALQNNTELLADLGFTFDFSESPCVTATAVPTFITDLDMEDIIQEIAENLSMSLGQPNSHRLDDILHDVACKSAIKANDKNTLEEMQALAEQVYFDERIRHCPHGRPVMFTVKKSNIAHQFKRT